MKTRLSWTILCLHISAVLYLVMAFFFPILLSLIQPDEARGRIIGLVLLVVALLMAIGIEVIAAGLKRHRFWAWVAAVIVCGLYIPSFFIILGVFGLWGLLDRGTRALFFKPSEGNL